MWATNILTKIIFEFKVKQAQSQNIRRNNQWLKLCYKIFPDSAKHGKTQMDMIFKTLFPQTYHGIYGGYSDKCVSNHTKYKFKATRARASTHARTHARAQAPTHPRTPHSHFVFSQIKHIPRRWCVASASICCLLRDLLLFYRTNSIR